jgi:hypothetical protein
MFFNSSLVHRGIRDLAAFSGEPAMKITINVSALGRSRWYEYVVRFFFGGAITVCAGLIAHRYGPGVGGLFLAFPAIFPSSATLVAKHQKQKKERAGLRGEVRGRECAGLEAAGAALGSIALLIFAVLVWRLLPNHPAWLVLAGATMAWLASAVAIWRIRRAV